MRYILFHHCYDQKSEAKDNEEGQEGQAVNTNGTLMVLNDLNGQEFMSSSEGNVKPGFGFLE